MHKRNVMIAVLVVAGLGAGAVWLMKPMSGMDGAPAQQTGDLGQTTSAALTVEEARPEEATWPVTVQVSGWFAPWAEAIIAAKIGGERIVAVNAEVGDQVKVGDLLAETSRDSVENRISELEAALRSAEAAQETAASDADRARKLSAGGSISQQSVAEYLATERKANAAVSVAEAQLATQRLNLENTRILAVSNGVVSEVSAALGQVVAEGQELFRLYRDNRIEWRAEVPLIQSRGIEPGTRVVIPSPFGDVEGKVRRVSPEASQLNGRVTVYVDLEPKNGLPTPKSGMMVTGAFVLEETRAIVVPVSAITMQDGFSYVFVIEGAGDLTSVRREHVETGRRRGDRVEILGELAPDTRLVLSGGAFLSDGSVVHVVAGAVPTESELKQ